MKHEAVVSFALQSREAASRLAKALAVELAAGPEGSTARLTVSGADARLRIDADDLSTLRAAVASAVRLADAAAQVLQRDFQQD